MRARFTGLWLHRDFLRMWASLTVSQLGSQVTVLALPLTAVVYLHATPAQMGILLAAESAPYLLVGFFAGVIIDRRRRRPVLIAADLGRALLLLTIPLAAALDALRIELLYLVAPLVGALAVFSDVAYHSFVPTLIGREQLVEGNSKLGMSRSVAELLGPGLAGALVQLLTAPIAIAIDAVSFLASALGLRSVRAAEPAPVGSRGEQGVWREIAAGLRLAITDPMLRSLAGCAAIWNLFHNMLLAVFVLYVTRELHRGPAVIGLVYSAGSVGLLCGALAAPRLARRFGIGPTIVLGVGVAAAGNLIIVPATSLPGAAVPLLTLASYLMGLGGTVYAINHLSLQQTLTPDHLQGRMSATMRTITWGTLPLGGLIGGTLGGLIGLVATVVVAAVGGALAFVWIVLSPIRTLREQPAPLEDPAVVAT